MASASVISLFSTALFNSSFLYSCISLCHVSLSSIVTFEFPLPGTIFGVLGESAFTTKEPTPTVNIKAATNNNFFIYISLLVLYSKYIIHLDCEGIMEI